MPEQEEKVQELAGHLFRHEAGKMAAVLTRLLGFQNIELAEDIVQDALLKALNTWKYQGIPDNPSAWLYRTAKNKAIDLLRKQQVLKKIEGDLVRELQSEWTLTPTVNQLFLENEIEDSQLRMIFACCHPSIPYESQIALTLKTLCGLSVNEIAHGFLTTEETISKRLYRAKEKIRSEKIELEAPSEDLLRERLDAVLHTLYLLFNEGYNSSHPLLLVRQDLCAEAIRLCILLTQQGRTNLPKTGALLALMCFQASRLDARLSDDGSIILLKYQNRQLWNRDLISRGHAYLVSAASGEELSDYHLEAAIAVCHAFAPSFEQTNWHQILSLYELLSNIKPGPIVDLNKAIVTGYVESAQRGIEELNKIEGLERHYLYHAALGDFYLQMSDKPQARSCYEQALPLTNSNQEKQLIEQKMRLCE
ncbi:MAG: sigma-70 family RNA polymerase sigma factor [Bacteroidota bacterium]